MPTPTEAIRKLRSDPESFLKFYQLIIVRAMRQSGPAPYLFGSSGYIDQQGGGRTVYDRTTRPGKLLGNLSKHEAKDFKFSQNQRNFVGNTVSVMAWHVDVSKSEDIEIAKIPFHTVSRIGGPDIILTTLLNGCTFICEPMNDNVLMAHIQPRGLLPGAPRPAPGGQARDLELEIRRIGRFEGSQRDNTNMTIFGGGGNVVGYNAATENATIIGIRQRQRWRMFAQMHVYDQRIKKETISRVVEFFSG